MIKKIILILATLILIILPFLIGIPIIKYSPYVESNSFKAYVIIWAFISIAVTSISIVVLNYYNQLFGSLLGFGLILFLLICPIIGIVGLAAAPDLSLKMLEHPEREHLRYIFLFIAAIIFGVFFLFLLKSNLLKIKNVTTWIITFVFILAFAEFIWEFTHHYLYQEGMKEWVDQGKNVVEFGKNYDNIYIINIGVLGRLFQFSLIIWLSIRFYQLNHIKIWNPIVNIILSLIGIISAIIIYVTQMNIPKGFEFLFLFFIPGIPFLLLYWLAVGLLTKFKKSDMAG